MSIIAFINQKGGTGKSTSSLHFAHWLATQQKRKVSVVDADPQRSLSRWFASMESHIPVTALTSADDLLEKIPVLAESVDFLVIDGGASLSEATRAILFRTDLAILPCQPSKLDLDACADTVRLVRQAQSVRKGAPKAAVFLSRAQKNTKLKTEAIAVLQKIPDVTALKTIVHQKQSVADSFGQAATVWDLSGSGAADAAAEFEQLFKEILRLVS
ncbi:ParA family protein [Coleofasciculus sp. FACHB-712]|uniref:ParA family protein n=1 Tax=Coleofasciculus sp. FACHB-712 TaxID=2692789 RepID=UPI001684B499|nr:ParA family protein [Coleofasciculus sp. FACHB-712]MBD1944867.1 ParA family protein [Coleofasciculus sp. FACHB-712]